MNTNDKIPPRIFTPLRCGSVQALGSGRALALCFFLSLAGGELQAGELHGFGPVQQHRTHAKLDQQIDRVGDFDGDGRDDLVHFWRSTFSNQLVGDVYVSLNSGDGFDAQQRWHEFFGINDELPLVGDFNGDGRDDIVSFVRGASGDVYVALSNGSGFGPGQLWHGDFCLGGEIPVVADINGDGMDDVLTFTRGTSKRVFAALSTGNGFSGTGALWHSDFCPGEALPFAGDVDGDGRDDIICFNRDSQSGPERGDVMVARSTGSGFGTAFVWHDWFSILNEVPLVGDVDGDGRADVISCARGASGNVFVALSTGAAFVSAGDLWHENFADGTKLPMIGRFNLDLNSDLIALRETTGVDAIETALAGGHAVPRTPETGEFGYFTMGVPWALPTRSTRAEQTEIPLIVALVEIPGKPSFASAGKNRDYYDSLFFGSFHPNIREYFLEMSAGRFTFRRHTVVGPFTMDPADYPEGDYWLFLKRELVNQGIDFRGFDTDGNGLIENKELVIAMIDNATDAAGFSAGSQETVSYGGDSIVVGSGIAAAGFKGVIDLYAHEMAHTIGAYDMYSSYCYGQDATLMHCNAGTGVESLVHLDPFHKMRLGWATPGVYDVNYPGGAFIDVAPLAGLEGNHPPIMLHDPRRDPNEFYMVDYRNPQWDDGTSTKPFGPDAGYDADVVERGYGVWYYNINAVNQFVRRHARIHTGDDESVSSVVAAGSDDSSTSAGIFPGPDGILQSVPGGDDGYVDDNMAYLSTTPAAYATRRANDLHNVSSNPLSPEWFDRSLVGGGIKLRFLDAPTAGPTGFVTWGREFVPFLEPLPSQTVMAGSKTALLGTLGSRNPSTIVPEMIDRQRRHELPVDQWLPVGAVVTIPFEARPGEYRVRISGGNGGELVSNSVPIMVENPYYDWFDGLVPGLAESDPDLTLPFADADQDGWANIGEFLLDTDPGDGSSFPDTNPHFLPGGEFSIEWTEVVERADLVRASVEKSSDLADWDPIPAIEIAAGGSTVSYRAVFSDTVGRGFIRLVFELR